MNLFWQTMSMVLLFTIIGGIFAAAETALISLRESQVKKLVTTKGRSGKRLEKLMEDPNRFLGAVQVGVTLAGFLSAGYGASRLMPVFSPSLENLGLSQSVAESLSFIGGTLLIAYLSLVVGELTPKRLALQHAERYALLLSGPVDVMAKITSPFIWLLSKSSDALLRIFGGDPGAGKEQISGEELRGMVAAHEDLTDEERELIDDVFSAGDREIREIMIPRTEVAFLDADLPVFKAVKIVADKPHSRYPVSDESQDDVVGFVHVRDLLDPELQGRSIRIGDLAREVLRLPGSKQVIPTLTQMRASSAHLAIVVDEYGGTAGIITMEDLVEELIGDIRDEYDTDASEGVIKPDTDLVIDGLLNLDDFAHETSITLPDGPYETVAGFVAAELGRLPMVNDEVDVEGGKLTVVEMDGRRVSRIHVVRNSQNRS
jgi:putative hemolysin